MANLFDAINKNVSRYVSFSEEELNLFNSLLEYKKVPKKAVLLREGQVCNFEAFILRGCVMKYYINENGAEVVIQFAIEDGWMGDISSFSEQKPSVLYIETMEECEMFLLSPKTKEELLAKVPKFERVFRILIQRHLTAMQNRLYITIAKTAQEKYLEFINQYPTIPNRVAQHHIASYLGISPEFLSKVRAKLAKHE
ncbi:MAG TPA: Crp/Fnr family transcriptional regulator [Chitinophagales bacterium]